MLDRFYPIFDSADWIARLLPQGVKLVQLRIKDWPREDVRDEIAAAKALCDKAGAQLIVNDYWKDAIDLKCDFVHLGQEDLDTADLPAIRRAGIKLGVSTHDEAELARGLETQPDYIALGPIYPTFLKEMKFAPQGLEKIGVLEAEDRRHSACRHRRDHAGASRRRAGGGGRLRLGRDRHYVECRSGKKNARLGRGDALSLICKRLP